MIILCLLNLIFKIFRSFHFLLYFTKVSVHGGLKIKNKTWFYSTENLKLPDQNNTIPELKKLFEIIQSKLTQRINSLLQFSYNFSSNKTLTLSSILLSLLLLNMLFIERPDGGILLKPSEKWQWLGRVCLQWGWRKVNRLKIHVRGNWNYLAYTKNMVVFLLLL